MNDQDDAGLLHTSAEEGIDRLYESLGALVQRTLTRTFGVPPREADKLVYEVLVEYVTRSTMVDDPKDCLTAMTGEAGRTWQRRNGIAPRPRTGGDVPLEMQELLLIPGALAALPKKVREMVRLLVEEQRTYDEIAAEMGLSAFYVEVAVNKAWERLRKTADRPRGK